MGCGWGVGGVCVCVLVQHVLGELTVLASGARSAFGYGSVRHNWVGLIFISGSTNQNMRKP